VSLSELFCDLGFYKFCSMLALPVARATLEFVDG